MDTFVPQNQFNDFGNVWQLIVAQVVQWRIETRIEQESFQKDVRNFLFQWIFVDVIVKLVDPLGFCLQEFFTVTPVKISLISSGVFNVSKIVE